MSRFCTPIPADIQGVKLLLPQRAFVESITWNPITQTVDLVWSTPEIITPFSTPQLFPIQNLHDQSLPVGVKYRHVRPASSPAVPVEQTGTEIASSPAVPVEQTGTEIPPVVDKPVDQPKARGVRPPKR